MEKKAGEVTHLETPWEIGYSTSNPGIGEDDTDLEIITKTGEAVTLLANCDEARANAAYIVKCVNAHEGLVEALRGCQVLLLQTNDLGDKERTWTNKASAALALAEGK